MAPAFISPLTINPTPSLRRSPRSWLSMQETTPRVLIVGGTGRTGSSTALALANIMSNEVHITIAGRNLKRGRDVVKKIGENIASLASLNVNDNYLLDEHVASHDIIVHTAGPFQRRLKPNEVLRSALRHSKDYIDICDDVTHAEEAKLLNHLAVDANSRALICTGVYPGLSNLASIAAADKLIGKPHRVRLYYYTAGSGGIGATVLASTFLILSLPALVYDACGLQVAVPAASSPEVVDFGGRVGHRTTYLLNLPEVPSLQKTLTGGTGAASAKFSTGPPFWNVLLRAAARWGPKQLMANQKAMKEFASFSLPVVRFVDYFSGARTAFIAVVEDTHGGCVTARYEHECLSTSVGETTAAFVAEMLRDRTRSEREIGAGIWYPEEIPKRSRERICREGTRTADVYVVEHNDKVVSDSVPCTK